MNQVLKMYQGQTRIRACGLCLESDRLLLLKHESLGPRGHVWIPPGGGLEYGTDLRKNLIREFKEETGLKVGVQGLLFTHELITRSLHAIEIFFQVERKAGKLLLGLDPEMDSHNQILKEVRLMPFSEINLLHPENKHQLFNYCRSTSELLNLRGYYQTKMP